MSVETTSERHLDLTNIDPKHAVIALLPQGEEHALVDTPVKQHGGEHRALVTTTVITPHERLSMMGDHLEKHRIHQGRIVRGRLVQTDRV